MTIVYLGTAWLAGIWLASNFNWPVSVWFAIGALGLAGSLFARNRINLRLGLICVTAVTLGGARYITAVPTINASHIAHYNDGGEITLTGLVVAEPDVRDRSVNLRLRAETVTLPDGVETAVAGDVQARVFRYPEIQYGMRLQLTGRIETPPEFEDFSYKDYLARQGVYSLMNLPAVTVLAEGQGQPLYHAIFAFKSRAQAAINRLIPDPEAALLSGILLGNDNGLPPDLADAFRATGMTHIIAISGFNIAILIAVFTGLAERFLPQRQAVILALVGIVLYTLLVGADASVVRAAIMGGLYLIASRYLGRPTFAYSSLFLAGWVMTAVNPFTLWDVGFQLSFAATLGLMLYAEPFGQWTRARLLRHLSASSVNQLMGWLSEAALVTLAAQILTLPLMMFYFGQASLISFPANALILPAQPGVMIWGGLAALTGMVVPAIGQVFGWIVWLFLAYTIGLVRAFAAVPGAAVPINVSPTAVLVLYAIIAGLTWLAKQDRQKRAAALARLRHNLNQRVALSGSLLGVALAAMWGASQPDGRLHVAFLDVGQGDAIFIQTPSGRQILVDGGNYPSLLNDRLGRQMPFWDREIDLAVATHPDADHVAGLVGLFERYRVGRLLTDGSEMGDTAVYDAVLQAAQEAGTPIQQAQAGEIIRIDDGVRLEILHPGPERDDSNRNENSVSIRLVYGDFSLLLTGDAEQAGEAAMLASGRPLSALLFKAGHHGSDSSSSRPFLEAVRPQIIIISVGADNNFGHPTPEMLQRAADVGAAVLRTDELGTIEVMSDGQAMWWQAVP